MNTQIKNWSDMLEEKEQALFDNLKKDGWSFSYFEGELVGKPVKSVVMEKKTSDTEDNPYKTITLFDGYRYYISERVRITINDNGMCFCSYISKDNSVVKDGYFDMKSEIFHKTPEIKKILKSLNVTAEMVNYQARIGNSLYLRH